MSGISKLKQLCLRALSGGIPQRSFYVAVIVGTILNLINQGDALLGDASLNWFKIVLTYLVPYGVYSYGAVSSLLKTGAFVGSHEPDNSACR